MKKIILGFFLGVIVLVLFLYLGGAKYLKAFGSKTEEAGAKLQRYEKTVQESAKGAGKVIEKTAVGAKEAAGKTAQGAKKIAEKTVDTTKKGVEKVKEYVGK